MVQFRVMVRKNVFISERRNIRVCYYIFKINIITITTIRMDSLIDLCGYDKNIIPATFWQVLSKYSSPSDVKVIVVCTDTEEHRNKNENCFGSTRATLITPSARELIYDSYNVRLHVKNKSETLDGTLKSWVEQGVMLINSGHSSNPGAYMTIIRRFIENIYSVNSEVVCLLLGWDTHEIRTNLPVENVIVGVSPIRNVKKEQGIKELIYDKRYLARVNNILNSMRLEEIRWFDKNGE